MTSVDAVGSQYTFTYNADGQRVAREDASATKKFIYDFKKVLQETDGNDATDALYTQSLDSAYGDLVSQFRDSASSYYNCKRPPRPCGRVDCWPAS